MESFDNVISDNYIDGAQYGIRLNLGSARNIVHHNKFYNIEESEMIHS